MTAHKGLTVGARFFPRSPYDGDTLAEQRRLKRRQAVEPSIGPLKVGHRMRRYFLKGALGDAMNPILAAAGFNNRWLMRWLVIDWRWILSAALGLFDQGDSDALSELGSAAASRNVQDRPILVKHRWLALGSPPRISNP